MNQRLQAEIRRFRRQSSWPGAASDDRRSFVNAGESIPERRNRRGIAAASLLLARSQPPQQRVASFQSIISEVLEGLREHEQRRRAQDRNDEDACNEDQHEFSRLARDGPTSASPTGMPGTYGRDSGAGARARLRNGVTPSIRQC